MSERVHDESLSTAYHEAGHVVVEVRISGSLPYRVYLNDNHEAGTDHAGRTLTGSFYDAATLLSPDSASEPWLRDHRKQLGAVLAAGDIASDMALGLPIDLSVLVHECLYDAETDSDSDSAKFGLLAKDAFGTTGDDAQCWLEDVAFLAAETLRGAWEDVERVAVALVEHRTLDREMLGALLFG